MNGPIPVEKTETMLAKIPRSVIVEMVRERLVMQGDLKPTDVVKFTFRMSGLDAIECLEAKWSREK